MSPAASVIITTKNRKDDLRRALASAVTQSVPVEILVVDDGSEDGTAEMVRLEFPDAKLVRSERSVGLIVQRNRAARAATTNFLFSLDDDAEFSAPDIVRRTLDEFDHPRVGAVAIPHVDMQSGTVVNDRAPDDGQVWCVASFTGTAYAVRRDVFLQLGGFREELVHQGEESDFCIRLLAAGWVVRLGRADMIRHHESPRRSFERMDYYGIRNNLVFAWRYAPLAWVGPHLLASTASFVRTSAASHRWRASVRGLVNGWHQIVTGTTSRTPVGRTTYRLYRTLKKQGPRRLADFERLLPEVTPLSAPANVPHRDDAEQYASK